MKIIEHIIVERETDSRFEIGDILLTTMTGCRTMVLVVGYDYSRRTAKVWILNHYKNRTPLPLKNESDWTKVGFIPPEDLLSRGFIKNNLTVL